MFLDLVTTKSYVIVPNTRENLCSCKWLTYLSEDFDKAPVINIRLLIGGENQDFSAMGADGGQTAIVVPAETLNAWQNPISKGGLFLFL